MLSSPKNPKVAAAARLHTRAFREADQRFLVEGAQGVREALAEEPPRLETLYTTDPFGELAAVAAERGVAVVHVSPDVMRRVTSTVTPQAVAGVAPFVDTTLDVLPADPCWTILHEVRDPGNAGTVLRSADAAGAGAVVFTASSVDVYNPKTVRASAGSVFHLPIVRGPTTELAVAAARARGLRILAMDARGADDLYAADLSGPVAFLFGNEAHGLDEESLALADARVRVPHAGRAESLNLAAAASVVLFEWARRQGEGEQPLETLIAAAAHDIRSPLTALKGFGDTLERRWADLTDEQRTLMLSGIVHDADRMDQLVRLLVDAARVSAGGLELFREKVEVADVVRSVQEILGRDPEHPGLEWTGETFEAFVDPARLKAAILAFVESLVWWGSHGPVVLSIERQGDDLRVGASRATDEDVGAEGVEALFTPRRPGMGQGSKFGLYVARRVAEAQGGRAWGSIQAGHLSFHLEIPAVAG